MQQILTYSIYHRPVNILLHCVIQFCKETFYKKQIDSLVTHFQLVRDTDISNLKITTNLTFQDFKRMSATTLNYSHTINMQNS